MDYIFLGRHVRLPLSALKVINQHHDSSEIIDYSENQFKALVDSLGRDSRVHLREKARLVGDFGLCRYIFEPARSNWSFNVKTSRK